MPLHALAALLRKRQARFPYVNAMTFEQWHSTHGFTAQLSRGVKPQLSLKSLQHLEPPTYGDIAEVAGDGPCRRCVGHAVVGPSHPDMGDVTEDDNEIILGGIYAGMSRKKYREMCKEQDEHPENFRIPVTGPVGLWYTLTPLQARNKALEQLKDIEAQRTFVEDVLVPDDKTVEVLNDLLEARRDIRKFVMPHLLHLLFFPDQKVY